MRSFFRRSLLGVMALILAATMLSCEAFAPTRSVTSQRSMIPSSSTQRSAFVDPVSSSLQVSASTLDPTTILSDILGGLLGSPAILLVPIGAALGVASLIAWLIVSYANPVVEDDEK